jgi:hypothetical protein
VWHEREPMAQPDRWLHPLWPALLWWQWGQQPCCGALQGDRIPFSRQVGHHHTWWSWYSSPPLNVSQFLFYVTCTIHEYILLIKNENTIHEIKFSVPSLPKSWSPSRGDHHYLSSDYLSKPTPITLYCRGRIRINPNPHPVLPHLMCHPVLEELVASLIFRLSSVPPHSLWEGDAMTGHQSWATSPILYVYSYDAVRLLF